VRNALNVHIEEIIIHILEPQGQGLVLSDVCLPLENDVNLTNYFVRHVQGSLKETSTKAARFRSITPDHASGYCDSLLRGEIGLVEGSRQLALALYQILQVDRRISPADLGICFYSADNYPDIRFLGLLKIDPSQVFRHTIRQDARGNRYVSFEIEPNAFTNERLQKCAFIQPLKPRHPDYDMLLLDRQTHGAEDARIAKFFSEAFLDSEEAFDPRKYSERLYRSLINAQNNVRDLLTPEQDIGLEARIRQAVTSPRINLDAWLDQLPLPENVRNQIDETIREGIPDREFNLDRGYSEQLVKKILYRGDYNLKLEIPPEYYPQIVVSDDYIEDDPERQPYHRIVIETETWKRIPK
jgi:hypothetical protein